MFTLYKYKHEQGRGFSLGFVFYHFKDKSFVNDYREFKTEGDAVKYLYSSKSNIILTNLERFLTETKFNLSSFQEEQALSRSKSGLVWLNENRHVWPDFVNNFNAIMTFLSTLSYSVDDDAYPESVMMYEMLRLTAMQFKNELTIR